MGGRSTARLARLATVALATALTVTATAAPAAAETVRQQQWHLDAVNALKAQRVAQGNGVIVAEIDTGVDASHPDLAGAVLPGVAMLGSTSDRGLTDPQGHGTLMAGLIAARGGGASHALGIAPKSKILPIAVPEPIAGSLAEPIRYAVDHGAKIINMSLGGQQVGERADELEAVAYARTKDVILVAAAGNRPEGATEVASPASMPGIIAVSGSDKGGVSWSGSVTGPKVAIAAPAANVVSAAPKSLAASGYGIGSGTSSSTAIVSGVLALIRSKFPTMNAANVINRLFKTATDAGPPGRDSAFGYGVVDAYAAVTATVPEVNADPLGPITAASPGGRTAAGNSAVDDGWGTPATRLAVLGGSALAVVLTLVLVLVAVVRRARRRRPVAPYDPSRPPYAYGPPGYPPPTYGQPHGQGPPARR